MDLLHRTWAEIDLDALVHNFKEIKRAAGGTALMAVVKANAYGHSACHIAPVLEECGAEAFAVSNLEEAITLRGCGITRPILILGYTPPACASQLYLNDITQSVYSPEYAAALSERAVQDGIRLNIHIKLDTGMRSPRRGFPGLFLKGFSPIFPWQIAPRKKMTDLPTNSMTVSLPRSNISKPPGFRRPYAIVAIRRRCFLIGKNILTSVAPGSCCMG